MNTSRCTVFCCAWAMALGGFGMVGCTTESDEFDEVSPLVPQPHRAGYGRVAYSYEEVEEDALSEPKVDVVHLSSGDILYSQRVHPRNDAPFLQFDGLLSRDGTHLFHSGDDGHGQIENLEDEASEIIKAPSSKSDTVVIPRDISADGSRALFMWTGPDEDAEEGGIMGGTRFGLWEDGVSESLEQYLPDGQTIISAALSADGTTIATVVLTERTEADQERFDYQVTVLELSPEEVTRRQVSDFQATGIDLSKLGDEHRPRNHIAISDDAHRLAVITPFFSSDESEEPPAADDPRFVLHTIVNDGSNAVSRYSTWVGPIQDVDLSPDGETVVMTARSSPDTPPQLVWFHHYDPGEPRVFASHSSRGAWSPDGQNMALVQEFVHDDEDLQSAFATSLHQERNVLISDPKHRVYAVSWGWD